MFYDNTFAFYFQSGCSYKGLKYQKGNCGVSIVRSGEAMEKALQDCCRSMRIGKILVDSDYESHEARVIFAKLPSDIHERKVLLLYPIMSSGNKVCRAMQVRFWWPSKNDVMQIEYFLTK